MAPVLFVGCVSEKTALIKPKIIEKSLEKIVETKNIKLEKVIEQQSVQLENNQTNLSKEKLLASAIFGGKISLENDENEIPIILDEPLSTQTFNLNDADNNWEAFSKEDEILETARKFLGVKYIWAANGPSAFDCSGFTKYVFKENGISLPRYSGHQANLGKKIKFKDLEKGDLVFFDTDKEFTRRVNHVGIFIGNNKFIHASSAKKKVIITSFSKKKFYKEKFLYARRIINSNKSFAFNNINTLNQNSLVVN